MDVKLILNRPRLTEAEMEAGMDFAVLLQRHQNRSKSQQEHGEQQHEAKILQLHRKKESNQQRNEPLHETLITL